MRGDQFLEKSLPGEMGNSHTLKHLGERKLRENIDRGRKKGWLARKCF